jgi:Protein of unknown function (DUF1579)
MPRTIACVVGAVALCVAGVTAQGPPPKPGPEHKKLEYFVGKWTTTGNMKASPMGPGGKIKATDTCEWFQGGFAVVCNSQGTGPSGPMKSIGIMSYSTDQKVYTYYGLDNSWMVMMSAAKGNVTGDTWTYVDEGTMGGQPFRTRFTLKTASPASYTFTWELLGPDKKWVPILEGTSTRGK